MNKPTLGETSGKKVFYSNNNGKKTIKEIRILS